jgi:tetratricopeptide (TPR) repeat protein
LAHTHFAAGNLEEAESFFQQAEQIWTTNDPGQSTLTSFWSARYTELLLDLGKIDEVQSRGSKALKRSSETQGLALDVAFDYLCMSFSSLAQKNYSEAGEHLQITLDLLREAGRIDDIPMVLIPRAKLSRETSSFKAARRDLDTTLRMATRAEMRLFECDAHLEYARLAIAEGKPDAALPHFQSAEALVAACGYHRRDGEVAELRGKLGL